MLLPEPTFFTPGAGEPVLRWGILGTGWIAGEFAHAVQAHTAQKVAAVGSRSDERARQFAGQHGIDRAHGTEDALIEDPGVDVVYVASPPGEHLAQGLRAIAAGKHVLMEKPLATSAADARTLVAAARAAGVFLMEAMWSRYQPQALVIGELLRDGVLGDIRTVHADLGQAVAPDPHGRLFRPDLGGGALLDMGIYPIQLDSMVRGTPRSFVTSGGLTSTGVDAHAILLADHGTGEPSVLTTSLQTRTPAAALIAGSEARIEIATPFHVPGGFRLAPNDYLAETITWTDPTGITFFGGLSWEATALARYVGEGRQESPLHTHDETVSILATIDEARRQIGAR
ncbi:Gfo/Idh/MocA family oxidoreductase [Actinoplanes sp. NBRC 101535]|uniref:Gfo/Idh/MocA family protein n=1 Tax=Actinoplanes sp. NBRC 101535 TaxID=3032196 RepID=UPI0024A440CF|nr:Gfo/Idh/MocA family oxidoreductase [Actinoplanes sp. NBRC 101535]GLY02757.1 oxidoreductase [Actinoplanes sp. NBRC 101535]